MDSLAIEKVCKNCVKFHRILNEVNVNSLEIDTNEDRSSGAYREELYPRQSCFHELQNRHNLARKIDKVQMMPFFPL
jgi:hypothetical protein